MGWRLRPLLDLDYSFYERDIIATLRKKPGEELQKKPTSFKFKGMKASIITLSSLMSIHYKICPELTWAPNRLQQMNIKKVVE